MKHIIRSLLTLPKITYKDENNDVSFDMSYITSRIIVSAGPTQKAVKRLYRYPIEDLVQILTLNHGDNWRIFNLRGEGKGYRAEDVYQKIEWFPFPDHQPPSFELMLQCIERIYHFLSQDPRNVALIHCKAGKGRSGTICCGYLMFQLFLESHFMTAKDANDIYTQKRMRWIGGKGVSIKSQLRYLEYWQQYLANDLKYLLDLPSVIIAVRLINVHYSTCLVRLGYYGNRSHTRHGVEIINHSVNFINKQEESSTKVIVRGLDFVVSVDDFVYCWFNVYFETIKSVYNGKHYEGYNMMKSRLKSSNIEGEFNINWQDMDGFKGTSTLGRKKFDSIQVTWKYI